MASGFEKGYEYFKNNAAAYFGADSGKKITESMTKYENITAAERETEELVQTLNTFKDYKTDPNILKGDAAEYLHAYTFNINALLKNSSAHAVVNRSHEFASPDITITGSDGNISFAGLKYYADGQKSAKAQSVTLNESYKELAYKNPGLSTAEFLSQRGLPPDTDINSLKYPNQQMTIQSDGFEEGQVWLGQKISGERLTRPDQAARYKEVNKHLSDRISDGYGVESRGFTNDEAKKIAQLAKDGQVTAEEIGIPGNYDSLRWEQAAQILQDACKAGISAAVITLVLKTVPAVYDAVACLIKDGELNPDELKNIGSAAISGAKEGFIHGCIAATFSSFCKVGLLGQAFEQLPTSAICAMTAITVNVIKYSFDVAGGRKTSSEMVLDITRDTFVSACSLALGGISETLIPVPILGYLIGSFAGSMLGSFIYQAGQRAVLSLCADTGFTMFGLVEQDYTLPDEIIHDLGFAAFESESFEPETFEPETFESESFSPETFLPESIDIKFLRRGVICANKIGYLVTS